LQGTGVISPAGGYIANSIAAGRLLAQANFVKPKSFLLLFYKKEALPCLPAIRPNPWNLHMPTAPIPDLSKPPLSLRQLRTRRQPLRDVVAPSPAPIKPFDNLAVWITSRVGTMGFFLVIFTWTVTWLGWNVLAPKPLQFDPPMAFVFWLFISNVIQILLMPLIMVGQNIQGRQAELRAEHDLDINVRAEEEIEVILNHLEYQNALLIAMLSKLDINIDEVLANTAPDADG
jgi:uncharacterized membrane protein